jgi:D-alanyl-D-alanine carboxypeptidase
MMPMSALCWQVRVRRCWALVGLVCASLVSACAWVPQRQADAQQHASLKMALAQIAESVDLSESPGYALRVSSQGQMLFAKDVGLASSDLHIPIDGQTIFELASLSKSFTALAVMQLHERGLIELEQPLSYYLPDVPKAWGAITVHHLLSHQSGLPDWLNQWPRSRLHALDFKALMQRLTEQPQLDFEPGHQAAYSNINYMLLAQLVEEVSGQAFADYLKAHVFVPADMRSSSVLGFAPEQVMQLALSYADATKIHGIDYALAGAISQKSSMADLENFMQALLSHRLVKAETLDLMMTPQTLFEDGKRYGYGWYIGQLGGWAALSVIQPAAGAGHTGRLGAYRTALYFNRQRDFQFIMLSNGGASTEKLLAQFFKKTREALE